MTLMGEATDATIRARLETMSLDELRVATTTRRDDYVPRALELAAEEIARREAAPPVEEPTTLAAPLAAPDAPERFSNAILLLFVVAGVMGLILYFAYDATFDAIMSRAAWLVGIVPLIWLVRRRAGAAVRAAGRRRER
jgi:hypothetical protein